MPSETKVWMLYTDTDSFFYHFFVEDMAKEIKSCYHLQDAFDFNVISNRHRSNLKRRNADLHGWKLSYFKDEANCNLIVEFIGLRLKMYSFTV